MHRYVGIVVYDGLIEEIQTFEEPERATAYVSERRHEYGKDRTQDSLVWDIEAQLPVRIV